MDYLKYIISLLILAVIGIIYDNFKLHYDNDEIRQYELVKKYLLSDSTLARTKKPLLWIHTDPKTNSRWWESFGSRNTDCLNQPYKLLCIKTILLKNTNDFNVCLIDDNSFTDIIPGWDIDLNFIASPIKEKIRKIAMAKLLKNYGGFILPSSFICFTSLKPLYNLSTSYDKMFVAELDLNNGQGPRTNIVESFIYPSSNMMGCRKNCASMDEYIHFLTILTSSDYTDESNFLGQEKIWFLTNKDKINIIPPKFIGAMDERGKIISIEQLMGNIFINIDRRAFGIYIPDQEILRRTKYNWFARMNAKQVMESDTLIGKLLIINQH